MAVLGLDGGRAPERADLERFVVAARWVAVALGVVIGLPSLESGDRAQALPGAVLVGFVVWRTLRPLQSTRAGSRLSLLDAAVVAVAAASNHAWDSPYLLVAVVTVVAAGVVGGPAYAFLSWLTTIAVVVAAGLITDRRVPAMTMLVALPMVTLLLAVLTGRYIRSLAVSQQRWLLVTRDRQRVMSTNAALVELTRLLRTSEPVDVDAIAREAGEQIGRAFSPPAIASIVTSSASSASSASSSDWHAIVATAESRWTSELRVRGEHIGDLVLARPQSFSRQEVSLAGQLAETAALTINNAQWVRRLRLLGAEEERTRIARDMHDGVGQWLVHLSRSIERVADATSRPDAREELVELHDTAVTALGELRDALWQLRATTEDRPLGDVANALMERFEARTGIATRLETIARGEYALRLARLDELEIFRILQEALNNVERHSAAAHVSVRWDVNAAGSACLEVADDGLGFDTTSVAPVPGSEGSFGMRGMAERADAIGAQLTVTSSPGAGTMVRVEVGGHLPPRHPDGPGAG